MRRNFPKTTSETNRDMTLNEFLQHIEKSRADSETQNLSSSSSIGYQILKKSSAASLSGHQKLTKDMEDLKRRSERRERTRRVPSTDNVWNTNSLKHFGTIENGFSKDSQIDKETLAEGQKRTFFWTPEIGKRFRGQEKTVKTKGESITSNRSSKLLRVDSTSNRRIPELSPDDVRGCSNEGETSYFCPNNKGYLGNEISRGNSSNNEIPIIDITNNSDVDEVNNEVGTGVVICEECIYVENDAVNGEACIHKENEVDMELENEVDILDSYERNDLFESYDRNDLSDAYDRNNREPNVEEVNDYVPIENGGNNYMFAPFHHGNQYTEDETNSQLYHLQDNYTNANGNSLLQGSIFSRNSLYPISINFVSDEDSLSPSNGFQTPLPAVENPVTQYNFSDILLEPAVVDPNVYSPQPSTNSADQFSRFCPNGGMTFPLPSLPGHHQLNLPVINSDYSVQISTPEYPTPDIPSPSTDHDPWNGVAYPQSGNIQFSPTSFREAQIPVQLFTLLNNSNLS